nr:unnamed protein product [Digitaria exilis]
MRNQNNDLRISEENFRTCCNVEAQGGATATAERSFLDPLPFHTADPCGWRRKNGEPHAGAGAGAGELRTRPPGIGGSRDKIQPAQVLLAPVGARAFSQMRVAHSRRRVWPCLRSPSTSCKCANLRAPSVTHHSDPVTMTHKDDKMGLGNRTSTTIVVFGIDIYRSDGSFAGSQGEMNLRKERARENLAAPAVIDLEWRNMGERGKKEGAPPTTVLAPARGDG